MGKGIERRKKGFASSKYVIPANPAATTRQRRIVFAAALAPYLGAPGGAIVLHALGLP